VGLGHWSIVSQYEQQLLQHRSTADPRSSW
jgi:hypothetical protein